MRPPGCRAGPTGTMVALLARTARGGGGRTNVAVSLVFSGFALAVLAPPLLVRLTHDGVASRLGMGAWLVTAVTVLGAWVGAAGLAGADLVRLAGHPGQLVWRTCMGQLRAVATGRYGSAVALGLWALAGVVAGAVVIVVWRLGRSLCRARAATAEHGRAARIAGRRIAELDAVVLDAAPTGGLLRGRPGIHGRGDQRRAGRPGQTPVSGGARPRASPSGRAPPPGVGFHPRIGEAAATRAAVPPRRRAGRPAGRDLRRRYRRPRAQPATVLDAVLALCGAGGPAAEPAGSVIALQATVGASGVVVLTRVERLAVPADSSRRLRLRLLLAAFTTLIAVGPVATALLATHGLLTCAPIMRT
jgi:hypothetical protein